MWNKHRETKNTKFYETGSGTKLFITFEVKVFRHEERKTQSFYADWFYIISSQPNQCTAPVAHKVIWPLKVNLFFRGGNSTNCFSQISAHASGAWCHPNTLVPIPIWDFYFDIAEWHILSARAWTPVLTLHLTNPCAKQKVLSLTKPKGKIYKTTPPTSVLEMILNNLEVRLQYCWSFGECRVALYCHHSQVHYGLEW